MLTIKIQNLTCRYPDHDKTSMQLTSFVSPCLPEQAEWVHDINILQVVWQSELTRDVIPRQVCRANDAIGFE